MNKTPIKRYSLRTLATSLLFGTASAFAQSNFDGDDEEIITLSPFEVSTTSGAGYAVSDSNSATKFAIDIMDAPFPITSLPKDVLDDSGYIDALDQLQLSSSASVDVNAFSGVNNRASIRGTVSPRFFVDGIFMNTLFSPDSIAVERIEILKGPSSMLFGQGEPGGTTNYTLKKASFEARGRVGLTVGNFDYRRAVVEWTGPLNQAKTLAGLVGFSHTDEGSHLDRVNRSKNASFARLRWNYDGPQRYVDVNHTWAKSATDVALSGQYFGDSAATARTLWLGFGRQGFDVPFDLLGDVYEYNRAADQSFSDVELNAVTLTWNHRINELITVNASYRRDNMERPNLREELNLLNASGVDSTFLWTDPLTGVATQFEVARGDIFSNNFYILRDDELVGESAVLNVLIEKDFDFANIKLNIGADTTDEVFNSVQYRSTYSHRYNPNNERASALPFDQRRPIVHGNVLRPDEGLTFNGPAVSSYTIPAGQFNNNNSGDAIYANTLIKFFDDRLSFAGAIRRDKVDLQNNQRLLVSEQWVFGDVLEREATTYSVGLSWRVVDSISLFANQAESFRPTLRIGQDANKNPLEFEPGEGDGYDIGARFSLFDDKLFIVASVFETNKTKLPGEDQAQDFDANGNLLFNSNGDPILFTYDTQDGEQSVSGIEIEANGQISDNLVVRFGWTHLADAEVTVNSSSPIQVGQRLKQSAENTVVFGIKYKFDAGFLEGTWMGVNVRTQQGEIFLDNPTSNVIAASEVAPGSPYVGDLRRASTDGNTNVDLFFNKTFKLAGEQTLKVQLNIFNVFDEKYWSNSRVSSRPLSARLSGNLSF